MIRSTLVDISVIAPDISLLLCCKTFRSACESGLKLAFQVFMTTDLAQSQDLVVDSEYQLIIALARRIRCLQCAVAVFERIQHLSTTFGMGS